MKKAQNPWTSRFDGVVNREEIRRRAAVAAVPLIGTQRMSDQEAHRSVEMALERIHYVGEQELDLLVRLVGVAAAHCAVAYPDVESFSRHLNAEDIQIPVPRPICMTGLPGTGKSELLKALSRVMPADLSIELGEPYRTVFQLSAYQYVEAKAKATISQVLHPFLPEDSRPRVRRLSDGTEEVVEPKISLPEAVRQASRYGYIRGRCLNGIDELQFLTGSANANTKSAQTLLTMSYLKAPLLYSANYILCHRLLKRPKEERDRLLADVEVVLPEQPDSLSFLGLLDEYQTALKEILGFRLRDEAAALYNMCVGVKRDLGRVVVAAHLEMRRQKNSKLTMDHVNAGYKSKALAAMRADVALLLEQAYSGKPTKGRTDLWCPFGVEFNQIQPVVERAREKASTATVIPLMNSSLSESERRVLRSVGQQASSRTGSPKKERATVSPLRRRVDPSVDAATLLANTEAHKNESKRPRKP